MLVNAVMYTFPPDKADQVENLFAELAVKSREEPGCIAYEVARGAGADSGTFMLFEKWRDRRPSTNITRPSTFASWA